MQVGGLTHLEHDALVATRPIFGHPTDTIRFWIAADKNGGNSGLLKRRQSQAGKRARHRTAE